MLRPVDSRAGYESFVRPGFKSALRGVERFSQTDPKENTPNERLFQVPSYLVECASRGRGPLGHCGKAGATAAPANVTTIIHDGRAALHRPREVAPQPARLIGQKRTARSASCIGSPQATSYGSERLAEITAAG